MPKPRIQKTSLPVPVITELIHLGERISIARKRRRLLQQQVARHAGISRLTVINMEKGLPTIGLRKVMAVSLIFNVESSWEQLFINGMPKPENQSQFLEDKIKSLGEYVGAGLKKTRKEQNFTLLNLAEALFVSPVTLSKLEKKGESSLGLFAELLCCLDILPRFSQLFAFQEDLVGQSLDYFRYQDQSKVRG
jgi:transcriptional regulator with XRE-family HTH domain